ncbi:unnamed protein product [Clonostachys rosea]|uniref:Uncharacterized protein n=1 Tax=Bionectria ochroleuca TaxID=29856 RepID=A0ABY6TUM8_BIOOC|nr:unnamed protein product [Clonostachys rosea]
MLLRRREELFIAPAYCAERLQPSSKRLARPKVNQHGHAVLDHDIVRVNVIMRKPQGVQMRQSRFDRVNELDLVQLVELGSAHGLRESLVQPFEIDRCDPAARYVAAVVFDKSRRFLKHRLRDELSASEAVVRCEARAFYPSLLISEGGRDGELDILGSLGVYLFIRDTL